MRKIPPRIELIFFRGCPHADAAREALRTALKGMGLPIQWYEWDQARSDTPSHLQGYGSPTVLVGGRDVTGAERQNGGRACRADGAPSYQMIVAALQ